MILSMTGYGTGAAQRDDISVAVEIRTVNHRFLDLHIRLAREYLFLEGEIQQLVRKALNRGRVDITVTIQVGGGPAAIIDFGLVQNYMEAANKLREQFGFQDSVDLKTVLSLPGVVENRKAVSIDGSASLLYGLVRESVREALQGVLGMRGQEGTALRADMLRNLANVAEKARSISALSLKTTAECFEKLRDRLLQVVPQVGIEPQRLVQEAAFSAEKCDISEEIARLESHIEQYRCVIETGTEVGKKLDFLLQEMQREANTILSKSGNLEITGHAIAAKTDIEKLREQVQNVE